MKNKSLIILSILILAMTSFLLVACNDQNGGSKNLSENVAISTDFEDKKVDSEDAFDAKEYFESLGENNFPVDKITEAKATYYDDVTEAQARDYLAKYTENESGWTPISATIFIKGRSLVFIDYVAEGGKLQITNITVSEEYANELNQELEGGGVSYNYEVTQPTKTEYAPGEDLDLTGFQIVKTGSDNSSVILVEGTNYTIDKTSFNTTLSENETRKSIYLPFEEIGGNFSGSISLMVIKPDDKEFVGAAFANAAKTYDGEAISATLTAPTDVTGYVVQYSYAENLEDWSEWSAVNPSFTTPCSYNVRAKISKEGYSDKLLFAVISITSATFENELDLQRDLMNYYTGDYDGEAHGGTRNEEIALPEGAVLEFEIDDDTYSTTAPTFTDVGRHRVSYRITKTGYNTVYGIYDVTIDKKDIPGVAIAYLLGEEYVINTCYADITVMENETKFLLRSSLTPLKPIADVFALDGTAANDVIKYSIDAGETWSETVPSTSVSREIYLKVFRGDTAETKDNIIVRINYIAATAIEFDDCGLSVSLTNPFASGENYSVSEHAGIAPFSPYVSGDTEGSVILVRSSADDGETWTEWTAYGDDNYELNNEYSNAGTYKYEYKYYKTGAGLCSFERTFVLEP